MISSYELDGMDERKLYDDIHELMQDWGIDLMALESRGYFD